MDNIGEEKSNVKLEAVRTKLPDLHMVYLQLKNMCLLYNGLDKNLKIIVLLSTISRLSRLSNDR